MIKYISASSFETSANNYLRFIILQGLEAFSHFLSHRDITVISICLRSYFSFTSMSRAILMLPPFFIIITQRRHIISFITTQRHYRYFRIFALVWYSVFCASFSFSYGSYRRRCSMGISRAAAAKPAVTLLARLFNRKAYRYMPALLALCLSEQASAAIHYYHISFSIEIYGQSHWFDVNIQWFYTIYRPQMSGTL